MNDRKATRRSILLVLGVLLMFYLSIMLAWSFTSEENAPTNTLWDWKREGYESNPLHDRYQIEEE